MHIQVKSANEAWIETINNLMDFGAESQPRGLKIKELTNYSICITNPKDRIISFPMRAISLPFAFGEFLWYISGRNDLEMMSYYSHAMKNFSDDGLTLNSAYGHRIFGKHPQIQFNQWKRVVSLLTADSDSRQAIIHLHTPNDKPTKDEVCTLTLQFLIRNGKLDMITNMRSNDINWGFTYDVFSFTMMQELMANELGVEVGWYYHNAGSMHIYEKDYKFFDYFDSDYPIELVVSNTLSNPDSFDLQGLTIYDRELANLIMLEENLRKVRPFTLGKFKKKSMIVMSKVLHNFYKIRRNIPVTFSYSDRYDWMMRIFQNRDLDYELIIIDGPDGAGKTTECNKLRDNFGYNVVHFTYPNIDFDAFVYLQSVSCCGRIALDRSFISEVVYATVFKRLCRISYWENRMLLKLSENARTMIMKGKPEYLKKEDYSLAESGMLDSLNQEFEKYEKMMRVQPE